MENIKLVVFDLAGTTIKDSGQVPEAFDRVLQIYGLNITPEEMESVRGASKREVIQSLIAKSYQENIQEKADGIFQSFRDSLAQIYETTGVHEIPGARATFEWLRSREIRIALNTGFDRWLTDLILRYVGWDRDLFAAVVCGDDVLCGRPLPDLIFSAMELAHITDGGLVANVGDTVLDLQAAANACVKWSIGVLSGAHKKELLQQYPHTHLIPSVASLPSLLERSGLK